MRRIEPITFDVEIHPEVWRQIAVVPSEVFRALQRGMAESAERLARAAEAGADLETKVTVPLEGYEALCEVRPTERLLRLVRISRTTEG